MTDFKKARIKLLGFNVYDENECIKAIKQNSFLIQYISSEVVQLEAIKQNCNSIRCIRNPSERVIIEAVKQDGLLIRFIKNPTNKVIVEAFKQNIDSFVYIDEFMKTFKTGLE